MTSLTHHASRRPPRVSYLAAIVGGVDDDRTKCADEPATPLPCRRCCFHPAPTLVQERASGAVIVSASVLTTYLFDVLSSDLYSCTSCRAPSVL